MVARRQQKCLNVTYDVYDLGICKTANTQYSYKVNLFDGEGNRVEVGEGTISQSEGNVKLCFFVMDLLYIIMTVK